jgi:hypothetical protein
VHVTTDATRSAAREAAFKYAYKLQAIATALRTDKTISTRTLALKFQAAARELHRYADSANQSAHGRVLAGCLHRYADTLKAKAKRPTNADELDAEATSEMQSHTCLTLGANDEQP